MPKSTKLRKLINNKHSIIVPGVYDALSARIADNSGFKAIFHTGYGTAASVFGLPDIGLVSFKEMVDHVRNICDATNVPVIADADTGTGTYREHSQTPVHEQDSQSPLPPLPQVYELWNSQTRPPQIPSPPGVSVAPNRTKKVLPGLRCGPFSHP